MQLSLWLVLFVGLSACTSTMALPHQMVMVPSDSPVLYLGADANAPKIAYVSPEVVLSLGGAEEQGRVPVFIEKGPVLVRAYATLSQLALRVQRRGRVRGTPAYVGPGDFVQAIGPDESHERLRIRVRPHIGETILGPYEGTYPVVGLGTGAARRAKPLDPGRRIRVPALTTVNLFESPDGGFSIQLPALPEPYEVRVVGEHEGWLAIRAGDGPYVVGWTMSLEIDQALPAATPERSDEDAGDPGQLPKLLEREQGPLMRVASGAQVRFGDRVIAVFRKPGWARVIGVHNAGYVDVFAAADDHVTVRGLMKESDLSKLSETTRRAEER